MNNIILGFEEWLNEETNSINDFTMNQRVVRNMKVNDVLNDLNGLTVKDELTILLKKLSEQVLTNNKRKSVVRVKDIWDEIPTEYQNILAYHFGIE